MATIVSVAINLFSPIWQMYTNVTCSQLPTHLLHQSLSRSLSRILSCDLMSVRLVGGEMSTHWYCPCKRCFCCPSRVLGFGSGTSKKLCAPMIATTGTDPRNADRARTTHPVLGALQSHSLPCGLCPSHRSPHHVPTNNSARWPQAHLPQTPEHEVGTTEHLYSQAKQVHDTRV